MIRYPQDLIQLIAFLKKLPGVGAKTAERFAFQLLNWPEQELHRFAATLATLKEKIKHCCKCHCIAEEGRCYFCNDPQRETGILCIIASPKDAFAIEQTRCFKGVYHVIGGLLSPIDGNTPDNLRLHELKERITALQIKEVIIALDSTLEGDATAFYFKEQLDTWGLRVSRLAFGLPIGSSLDFVDSTTLTKALTGRQSF
jgi:recombination protein RecR